VYTKILVAYYKCLVETTGTVECVCVCVCVGGWSKDENNSKCPLYIRAAGVTERAIFRDGAPPWRVINRIARYIYVHNNMICARGNGNGIIFIIQYLFSRRRKTVHIRHLYLYNGHCTHTHTHTHTSYNEAVLFMAGTIKR